MKKVFLKKSNVNMPNKFIISAYAGACAAHHFDIDKNFFGKNINFHDYFCFDYSYVKNTCKNNVKTLPSKLSLREVVLSSPANYALGGF